MGMGMTGGIHIHQPYHHWLVVLIPLKNMSSSLGMMTFPIIIYGKIQNSCSKPPTRSSFQGFFHGSIPNLPSCRHLLPESFNPHSHQLCRRCGRHLRTNQALVTEGHTSVKVTMMAESSSLKKYMVTSSARDGYSMIFYDILWYSMIFYDILWYSMIFYDILWYSIIIDLF